MFVSKVELCCAIMSWFSAQNVTKTRVDRQRVKHDPVKMRKKTFSASLFLLILIMCNDNVGEENFHSRRSTMFSNHNLEASTISDTLCRPETWREKSAREARKFLKMAPMETLMWLMLRFSRRALTRWDFMPFSYGNFTLSSAETLCWGNFLLPPLNSHKSHRFSR